MIGVSWGQKCRTPSVCSSKGLPSNDIPNIEEPRQDSPGSVDITVDTGSVVVTSRTVVSVAVAVDAD